MFVIAQELDRATDCQVSVYGNKHQRQSRQRKVKMHEKLKHFTYRNPGLGIAIKLFIYYIRMNDHTCKQVHNGQKHYEDICRGFMFTVGVDY
jgi:hypothetical protein